MTKKAETPIDQTTPDTPTPDVLQLDPKLLQQIVAAVAAGLQAQGGASPETFNVVELGKAIGDAVSEGIERKTRRKISFGEYMERGGSSVMHPKPQSLTPTLKRNCYQNHFPIHHDNVTDRDIVLLNALTHGGRYFDRFVEVRFNNNGSGDEIDIVYPDKDVTDRFKQKEYWRTFTDLLEQLVVLQAGEREEQDALDEERRERRRKFGQGKATREAEAKAAAKAATV